MFPGQSYQGNALPEKKKHLPKYITIPATILLGASILGGIYFGTKTPEQETPQVKKEITREYPYQTPDSSSPSQRYPSLDEIIQGVKEPKKSVKPEPKKAEIVKVDPYNSTTVDKAMEVMDYSCIENLQSDLQEEIKETVREEIFSSPWGINHYPKLLELISKFDDKLKGSEHYALLTQEVGQYILNKEKIPESSAGATGWGQLMQITKKEHNIEDNAAVDNSLHLIHGIEALVKHYDRYSPSVDMGLQLGYAIYNYGYNNVMKGLADIVEKKGGDPENIFKYSKDKSRIHNIKNPELLQHYDISYEEFKDKIPKETEDYIRKATAIELLYENINKFENMQIDKQPPISQIFKERKLGDYDNLWNLWEAEVKEQGVPWDVYKNYINMHIKDAKLTDSETRVLVPKNGMPVDYFG